MPARIDDSSMSGAELELSDRKKEEKKKKGRRKKEQGVRGSLVVHRIPLRFKRNRECIKQSSTLPWGEGPTTFSGSARDKRINSIPVLAAFPGRLTRV